MRADRLPGRPPDDSGPRQVAEPARGHHSPPPSRREATHSVSRGLAGLLDLSGERDQRQRLALAWARSEYRRGYHDGHDAGYRAGYELAVAEWKITAAGMTHLGGPSFAELDRRRYPPDGRLSWIIPRPGDDTGRQHHG